MVGIPRIPGVPDLLRRVKVPRDLDSVTVRGGEVDPEDAGMTREGVERIWADAQSLYRSGVHPAIQVCVRREGAVVLNRAIGHARGNVPGARDESDFEPVSLETPFCVYSASKAITAVVLHKLIEQGAVGIDTPVAEYIPGYDRHGKGEITIGHVLAHRAGVPNLPPEVLQIENIGNRELLVEVLCDTKPFATPGRLLAYHAVSGGFILGEVVHQATGKNIRDVLQEEFLDPLGFRWMNFGVAPEDVAKVGQSTATGPPLLPPLSILLSRALGASLDEATEIGNDPAFLTGVVPAANTVTSAEELSRFYEMLRRGGELDGVRVLEPETIRHALTEQSHLEVDLSLGFPTRFSYGFMLGSKHISLYGPNTQHAFGHLGFTNILSWADPERAIAVAVITSGKPAVYPELPRFYNLMRRIGREAPKVDESEFAF